MRLLGCKIENFGKLSNFSCSFEEGCNTILADNGWGKTTLAVFIRVMLYGFENEKGRTSDREREKYNPWQGGTYGGELRFAVGEKEYSLRRNFGKKATEDTILLVDLATGLTVNDFGEGIGEELFGVDSSGFARTSFLGQSDCQYEVTDSIYAKLGDMAQNTDDVNSCEAAIKRIADLTNYLSPNRKTGKVYRDREVAGELKRALFEKDALVAKMEEIEGRGRELNLRRKALEEEQGKIKNDHRQTNRYQDQRELLEKLWQNYVFSKRDVEEGEMTEEESETLLDLEMELEACETNRPLPNRYELDYQISNERKRIDLEREVSLYRMKKEGLDLQAARAKKSPLTGLALLLALAGIIGGVGALFYSPDYKWYGLGAISLGLFLGLLAAISSRRSRHVDLDLLAKIDSLSDQLDQTKREEDRLYKEVKDFAQRYGVEENEEGYFDGLDALKEATIKEGNLKEKRKYLESLRKKKEEGIRSRASLERARAGLLQYEKEYLATSLWSNARGLQFDSLIEEEKSRLLSLDRGEENLARQEELGKAFALVREEEMRLDHEKDFVLESLSRLEEKAKRLSDLEQTLAKEERDYRLLSRTGELLAQAKLSFSDRYKEPVWNAFCHYYAIIDRDSEKEIQMDARLSIASIEQNMPRDVKRLSAGTRDLLGICMRLALVKAMYREEKPFLVMDDPFVNLDDRHLEMGKAFLKELEKEYQILYFTCQENRKA